MAVNLTVNAATFAFPTTGDEDWGSAVTGWASAVTSGMLQKAGGSFTLSAEVDFGAAFGLKALYYKSRNSNPAATGQVRLGNAETIAWRNQANNGDKALSVNSSNQLVYDGGVVLALAIGAADTVLRSDGSVVSFGKIENANVDDVAQIAFTKMAALTSSRAVELNGDGVIVASAITATELGYLDNLGSNAQDQLNARILRSRYTLVEDYGAVGDGTTDDATALTNAASAAASSGRTLVGEPGKTYRIESDVVLRSIHVDFSRSVVLVVGSATKLIVGGNSNNAPTRPQSFYQVYRDGGVNANPTVRVLGMKNGTLTIDYCDYLQLYADTDTASSVDSSIAYSVFNLNYCQKLELATNPSPSGSTTQWINENTFNLKRTATLNVKGTYHHNNNIFNTGCFEGGAVIDFEVGTSNVINCARFESTNTITFDSGTWHNKILQTFESDQLEPYRDTASSFTYTDNGNNYVHYFADTLMRRYPLLVISPGTCQSYTNNSNANQTTLSRVNLQAYGIEKFSRDSGGILFESPLIPVKMNDGFLFKADITRFRTAIRLYDSDRKLINITDHPSMSGYISGRSGLTFDGTSQWDNSSNVNGSWFRINNSAVAYVKHNITGGSSGTGVPFSYMSLELLDFNGRVNNRVVPSATHAKNASASSSPTRGYAPEVGVKVSNTAGGWFTNTFSKDTTITVAQVATDTTITVASVTSITSGDIVGLELDDGSTHWTTVNGAPSGSVVTLTNALPSGAAAGKRVVFNRWIST